MIPNDHNYIKKTCSSNSYTEPFPWSLVEIVKPSLQCKQQALCSRNQCFNLQVAAVFNDLKKILNCLLLWLSDIIKYYALKMKSISICCVILVEWKYTFRNFPFLIFVFSCGIFINLMLFGKAGWGERGDLALSKQCFLTGKTVLSEQPSDQF